MTTAVAGPDEIAEQRAQLRPVLRNSRVIGIAGVLSVYFGLVIGSDWVRLHRAYWFGEWRCGGWFRFYGTKTGVATGQRYALTIMALAAAVTIAVALIRLAKRGGAEQHRSLTAYWLATAVLWVCLAAMPLVTVFARRYCGL